MFKPLVVTIFGGDYRGTIYMPGNITISSLYIHQVSAISSADFNEAEPYSVTLLLNGKTPDMDVPVPKSWGCGGYPLVGQLPGTFFPGLPMLDTEHTANSLEVRLYDTAGNKIVVQDLVTIVFYYK